MQEFELGNSDEQNPPRENHFDLSIFMKKKFITFFLSAIMPLNLLAQSNIVDHSSSVKNQALANAMNIYNDAIGDNSMILTGSYYIESNTGVDGDPFFINNFWNSGSIVYEGQRYDSIDIRYDIYSDLVIIKYVDKLGYVRPIQLHRSKVEEFILMDHHFIRLEGDSLSTVKTGFFDLLYDGEKASVLAKRRKEISRTQSLSNLVKKYYSNDIRYIRTGHNYYVVKGKKSLLEVLSDRKDEVKTFLKKNKARLRKDYERQFIEAVQYYNSIVNNTGS
jgi:hypothetical protein